MRTIGLFLFCLAACHSGEDQPARKIVPVVEPELDPGAARADASVEAGPTAALRDLDGGPAPRSKLGAVRLCEIHVGWVPPAGFTATAIPGGVAARRGAELLAVLFPPHAEDAYARASAAFVDGQLSWDPPAMKRFDDWHAESTTHGRASGLVAATRTLYAGVDPKTSRGRPEDGANDVVWIAIAPTEPRADALLADARAHALPFVDHACECGYDCYERR